MTWPVGDTIVFKFIHGYTNSNYEENNWAWIIPHANSENAFLSSWFGKKQHLNDMLNLFRKIGDGISPKVLTEPRILMRENES